MDSESVLSTKQQKSRRLDAFVGKIGKSKQFPNGSVFSENKNAPPKTPVVKNESVCLHCHAATTGAEVCGSCAGGSQNAAPSQMKSGVGLVCPICTNIVINCAAARRCGSCNKFVHRECDSSALSGMDDFLCASCRRSPLVGDVMLTANAPASPLATENGGGSNSLLPPTPIDSTSTLNPFRTSSPVNPATVVPDFHVDVYNLSEGISSPATTSDSARNSPFYPENSPSDVDEDFVPGSTRGGYRGRGGKKKPGRGQGLMKTRSGGKPPSGVFSDKLGQSTRGKRGKRGANKATNGKGPGTGRGRGRGRGSAAAHALTQNSVLHQIMLQQQHLLHQQQQQAQQQSLIREVDQSLLDDMDRSGGHEKSEDNEYVRTVVISDATNPFLDKACLCLVCGSVGKGPESSMVACSNCAQTYHTYCVGLHDKLNHSVVFRGWRCLDCTVCEGCGEGKDETKLLLCEECDVSYHIYCLNPPLERIPAGPWRCQWCARCRRCNLRVASGTELTREGLCTGCHSLKKCPKCAKLYQLGDKIIKCSACVRWYHGTCVDLYNDEMLESACANKMRCPACRPSARNMSSFLGHGDHANLTVCDGVALNKCADEILQSRFMPNCFRPAHPLDGFGFRSDSFDHYMDDDFLISEELEMITTSTGRGRGMGRGGGPGRRVPKLGVGGFFVKIPRHRAMTMDEEPLDEDGNKKMKRPRKPRRSQLEDAYPPAIQEGFFGSRPVEGKSLLDAVVEEPRLGGELTRGGRAAAARGGHELSSEATEMLKNDLTEVDILENVDLGEVNIDEMDFSNWIDDEDGDGEFDDSLNDAIDFVKSDGYDPSRGDSQSQQSASSQPTTFPPTENVSMTSSASATPTSYMMAATVQSLSRSSSQMDTQEKQHNPNLESSRWEEDEPLGSQSTKAAVLYANVKHGYLKEQYPEWNDRVKHIQRLWRTLDSENRQDFVNRARENRANRGKQPRVRKVVSSASLDSPKIQSPTPQQFYRPGMMSGPMDGRFKVPTMPGGAGMPMGGPGPSQMRPPEYYPGQEPQAAMQQQPQQQIRVTSHLAQPVLEQYDLMNRRTEDLRKHQEVIEGELNRMRKQKKNLAAKRRQMIKSAGGNADGTAPQIDLNEADSQAMEQLKVAIPARQKDLEGCKREIKGHMASIYEFEHKHEIIRNMPTDPAEVMRLQMAARGVPGNGGMVQHGGPPHGLPPGTYPQHPQMHPQFQQMRVPQQVPYGMMQHPGGMAQPHMMRPPPRVFGSRLGGIMYEQLHSQFEREIYECVEDMVMRVAMVEDPQLHERMDPSRESGMLKRLLEPSTHHPQLAALHNGPPGGSAAHLMDLEPPRPKKKRQQPKKPGVAGNEYELMVERVKTQLRLCDQLPRQALEPAPRNPGAAFATIGISDLPDRPNKRAMQGYEIGNMSLSFVEDYFLSEERGIKGAISTEPSMLDLCLVQPGSATHELLARLQQCEYPEPYEQFCDEEDRQWGVLDVMGCIASCTGRFAVHDYFRVGTRVPDVQQPLEPHRTVFHTEREKVEEVEISLTLRTDSSEMGQVVENICQMLGMEGAVPFEMDTPPMSPEATNAADQKSSEVSVKRESTLEAETQTAGGRGRCRGCDTVMQTVKVHSSMSQLGIATSNVKTEKDDAIAFCSMKCYYQFVASSKVVLSTDQLTQAELHVDEETLANLRQINAENFAKCIQQGKMLPTAPSLPTDSLLTSPRDTRYVMDEGKKDNLQVIRVGDLAAIQEVSQRKEVGRSPGDGWKVYNKEMISSFARIQAIKMELALAPKMGVPPAPVDLDRRVCVLCGGIGDGETSICGRLLNLGANLWVHVNCALWSAEVYESPHGGLLHVDRAIVRAAQVVCRLCGRVGASIQCHKADCVGQFHLPCAKRIGGKFIKDRTFFCPNHHEVTPDVLVAQLDALRRIFIERDETALLGKLFEINDGAKLCMRLGALTFYKVGQLLADQMKAFHNANFIYPNGYKVSRWFWSPSEPRARVLFECSVREKEHRPCFVVTCGEHVKEAESATGAWESILCSVEKLRSQQDAIRFFPKAIQGETLFGLGEAAVTKITESLPGLDTLYTYQFRHGQSPLLDLPLAENPSGSARCEPRFRTLIKHKPRTITGAGSSSGQNAARASTSSGSASTTTEGRTRGGGRAPASFTDELAQAQMKLMLQGAGMGSDWAAILGGRMEPLANNSQGYSLYQKMRKEWRQTVYLARSKIQGLGLYARRDINMGDMIIEYKGEVIRSEVGEVREKRYEAQNRGVYMFRIDEELLVDATMAGGPARYINHSCDPNCSTKILAAGPYPEDKKIIITANRPIKALEELTYDYQFELEDDTTKIPCLCGAPNCVKWMN